MKDLPEIMFTVDDITQGDKLTRKLILKSGNKNFDGKTVEYRPLNGDEFRNAMRKAGLSATQSAAESFDFMMEAAKVGICNPGVGGKIREVRDVDVIRQIGEAVLAVSQPDEKQVASFPENK